MSDVHADPAAPNAASPSGQPNDDLKALLGQAELNKVELEKKEISLRIAELLNWKQKWAQLAISFFIPIATAAIALIAASVELRSIRADRTQLQQQEVAYEQRKATEYVALQANHAVDMLRLAQDSPATDRMAVLNALKDLLAHGAKLPEASVETIFPLLLDPDQPTSDTARAILDSSAPPTYARLLASSLATPTPPIHYKLVRIVASSQFSGQTISYIAPLASAGDSVVAGGAIRALAGNLRGPLNAVMPLDDGSSDDEVATYLVTALTMQDTGAKRLSLKYLSDRLLSTKSLGDESSEFYGACIVNKQGDVYGQEVLQRNDISSTSKILLGVTLPKSMRGPAAAIATAIFADFKKTADLLDSGVDPDFISAALGISPPSFTIKDFTKYSLDEISTVDSYINFDEAPHTALLKLRDDLEANDSSDSSGSSRLNAALIKQDGYDIDAVRRDGIGDDDDFILQAANSGDQKLVDEAYDMFKTALRNKKKRSELFSEAIDITVSLIKAGKPHDLLDDVYANLPFEFLADLDKIAAVDRDYAARLINKLLESKVLTSLQAVMLAVKAGLESDFSALAQDAFDEQLRYIGSIRQSDLRERPNSYGDIDQALVVLSLLRDSPDFRPDIEKLKKAIEALGLVPAKEHDIQLRITSGSFSIEQKDGYAKLAQALLPDVLAAISGDECNGRVYENLIRTDQLRDLVWSAIMN